MLPEMVKLPSLIGAAGGGAGVLVAAGVGVGVGEAVVNAACCAKASGAASRKLISVRT